MHTLTAATSSVHLLTKVKIHKTKTNKTARKNRQIPRSREKIVTFVEDFSNIINQFNLIDT